MYLSIVCFVVQVGKSMSLYKYLFYRVNYICNIWFFYSIFHISFSMSNHNQHYKQPRVRSKQPKHSASHNPACGTDTADRIHNPHKKHPCSALAVFVLICNITNCNICIIFYILYLYVYPLKKPQKNRADNCPVNYSV